MFMLIILAASVLLGGAAAVHGTQVTRAKHARHRQQAADAEATQRAAQESEAAAARARQEAEAAAVDMRRTRNPQYYISVQRARIERLLSPIRELRRQRTDELGQLEVGLREATPPVSRLHQMLTMAAPVMLVVLFLISISQLGPSFQVLTDPQAPGPVPLDWVYAVLLAALEICVAFMVAHFIKPERGWKEFGPKLAIIPVLLLAGLLVYGQYTWAPLHDVVPAKEQLAQAQEQLVLDQQAGKPQIDITADQQAIDEIQGRLPRGDHARPDPGGRGHAGGRRRRHPGAERAGLPCGSLPTAAAARPDRERGPRSAPWTSRSSTSPCRSPWRPRPSWNASASTRNSSSPSAAPRPRLPRQARRRPRLPRQSRPPRGPRPQRQTRSHPRRGRSPRTTYSHPPPHPRQFQRMTTDAGPTRCSPGKSPQKE